MKLNVSFRIGLEIEVPDDLTTEQLKSLDICAPNGFSYYDFKTKQEEYVEFEQGLEPVSWTQLESYEVVK